MYVFVEISALLTLPKVTSRIIQNYLKVLQHRVYHLVKFMENRSCHIIFAIVLTNAADTATSNRLGPIIYHPWGREPSLLSLCPGRRQEPRIPNRPFIF